VSTQTLLHVGQLLRTSPPELIVYDRSTDCPYLSGCVSRLPLRYPVRPLTRTELAHRLAAGDRREGKLLYRPECSGCAECVPIRLNVDLLEPSRTQRRTYKKLNQRLTVELAPVEAGDAHVSLYNAHRIGRRLGAPKKLVTKEDYELMFVETCCESFELRYFEGGELVGVGIVDRAQDSLSAVYSYYDPNRASLSLGTFSILKQVELCRRWGLKYLYLGFYVADNPHMRYKARFNPSERLIRGQWKLVTHPTATNGLLIETNRQAGAPVA
jgi:leucyl-tRNA---protein transferase